MKGEGRGGEARAPLFTAKEISVSALMTALLIGGQYTLSSVAGVEIVTVMLLVFCCTFGRRAGVLTATAFSVLRGIVFGFMPYVIVLYLVYFNAFALFFGSFAGRGRGLPQFVVIVFAAVAFTACFTLLDDLLYPLWAGLRGRVWKSYFLFSLPVMAAQCVCAAATVSLLFYPLEKILSAAKGGRRALFVKNKTAGAPLKGGATPLADEVKKT